jgi:ubiquinone biosynthesis accessory factor UbiJ
MSPVRSLLERALAQASARARTESPRARALLEELAGKRLAIAVVGTSFERTPLVVSCNGQSLGIMETADAATPAGTSTPDAAAGAAGAADATLSGAPLSLLALTRDAEAVIHRGDVHVTGDAQVAQRFRELGVLLAPDLEHELSRLLGRSAAHLLMSGLRTASHAAREVARTSVRNLAEYLAHENGTLVSRAEAEHFLRGVEQAREQLDRLEARIAQLERSAAGTGGAEPA